MAAQLARTLAVSIDVEDETWRQLSDIAELMDAMSANVMCAPACPGRC